MEFWMQRVVGKTRDSPKN